MDLKDSLPEKTEASPVPDIDFQSPARPSLRSTPSSMAADQSGASRSTTPVVSSRGYASIVDLSPIPSDVKPVLKLDEAQDLKDPLVDYQPIPGSSSGLGGHNNDQVYLVITMSPLFLFVILNVLLVKRGYPLKIFERCSDLHR